jgi:hypothetical protein
MRLYVCICFLALLSPCVAFARQSATAGYSVADQEQFDKLRTTVGTWNCSGAAVNETSRVVTTTQQGNLFVSHETGENAYTTYTHWSHGYQKYISVRMNPLGTTSVSSTTSADPNNATWVTEWPAMTPDKEPIPARTVATSGNTMVWSGQSYVDGRTIPYKETCVRQS